MKMSKIFILDNNGTVLGYVLKQNSSILLLDYTGKTIQEVPIDITIKRAKDILLKRKFNYVM